MHCLGTRIHFICRQNTNLVQLGLFRMFLSCSLLMGNKIVTIIYTAVKILVFFQDIYKVWWPFSGVVFNRSSQGEVNGGGAKAQNCLLNAAIEAVAVDRLERQQTPRWSPLFAVATKRMRLCM